MRFVLLVLVVLVSRTAAADWEPVRWRLGTMAIDNSRYAKDILALAKDIENRTRGSVKIDWITGGQLGDDTAMANLVARGKLDGGGFTETGLIALVPDMAAFRYAGLFRDYADVDRATAAVDDQVRHRFESRGMRFLMWADLGFAHLFSIDPIANLRDLLGKAAPWLTVPIDTKLTQAIISGRARAWALPPLFTLAIANAGPRYMTNLRYRYVAGGLVVSKAAWAKLGDKQRKVVLEVVREWQPRIRARWRAETDRGIAALVKNGVAIRESSHVELSAFFEAAARTRNGRATPKGMTELLRLLVDALAVRAP